MTSSNNRLSCSATCSIRRLPSPVPTTSTKRACLLFGAPKPVSKRRWERSDMMPRSNIRRDAVIVSAVVLSLCLSACKHESASDKTPLPVHTAMVQSVAVGNAARYSASIVPYSQVDLAFQSSGYVDRVRQVKSASGGMRNIDQGDWVTKGTVLAVVSQQNYQDKLEQAKAQLAGAEAQHLKDKLSFDR